MKKFMHCVSNTKTLHSWASLVAQFTNCNEEESACNAGDLGLIPGLGRSPGEGNGLPTPVFLPGDFHELYSPWSLKESDTTERLSLFMIS